MVAPRRCETLKIKRSSFGIRPSETINWRARANRRQEGHGAVGGTLLVTGDRIVFSPNLVNRLLLGGRWETPVASVRSIELVPSGGDRYGGGFRDRLGIRTTEGLQIFVVNRVESRIRELHHLLRLH
jgi:hypothetical protein